MTVAELIAVLQGLPPELLVTRADADWHAVKLSGTVVVESMHPVSLEPGERAFWECAEFPACSEEACGHAEMARMAVRLS